MQKYKKESNDRIDDRTRVMNFKKATLFGPIFICSCCKRRLYENGVTKITPELKQKFESKNKQIYNKCIVREELVKLKINGSDHKTGHYICGTCKATMMTGKVPSMAEINGLQLLDIDKDCYLTDLENNLIALNLNFQYIFSLQKSRWAATKNQMISVPVTPNTVMNTVEQLPRLPKDAGLIAVKLKRKKIYKNCHKKEFVDPRKIFKALEILKKSGTMQNSR